MSVGTSSTSQVAILGARGRLGLARDAASPSRVGVRLVTFGALALYATLKWATLLSGGGQPRLLGLLALALLLAAGRPLLARQSRWLAATATLVALLLVFPLAGVPFAWLLHLRIAVTANAIGNGLAALPQVLVPYSGVNQWVTLVIMLGGAVLLFDAALLVAFAPRAMEDLRRAGAALPLVAMAAVPATLVRPSLPYLDGAVLFALLVAFAWGERIGPRRAGGALGLCGLAVVAAMFAAPALDRHQPWFNYRALANGLSPTAVDGFDWSQGYGPIDWPRKGRVVLEIQASHPEYWKAENLDAFNGVGWAQATGPGSEATPRPDAGSLKRWTQRITVTDQDMKGPEVIGAGVSKSPSDLSQVSPGQSPGTWTSGSQLVPGDSYRIQVYAPHPSALELTAAGTDYTRVPVEFRTIYLVPSDNGVGPASQVIPGYKGVGDQPGLVFPRFHSSAPIHVLGAGASGATLLAASDQPSGSRYGDAYRLARRLAAGAATPYDFALAVENYLHRGYTYNENPPRSSHPLTSFLFATKVGYCQQFAGAMALLLRMGGVPARVAVGFTSGRLDSATHRWQVTDFDAHAWVEAWFPHYGWVSFDPTPAADPAFGGRTPIVSTAISSSNQTPVGSAAETHNPATTAAGRHGGFSGGTHAGAGPGIALTAIAAIAAVAMLALVLLATKPLSSVDALVAELEGALRRVGRPLPAGATLAGFERRIAGSPDASGYVRALRVARFGGGHDLPTPRQRRALRRELRLGGGPFRVPVALWALPPRWGSARTRARPGPDA